MRRLKNKILLTVKKIGLPMRGYTQSHQYIHKDVPYYSQWESRELVEQIITKKMDARKDPRWQDSGADNPDEYAEWSWNGCGMACLKMILASTQNTTIPLVTLGKKCTEYGGYQLPLETSPGLFYKPFVKFVGQEFGLKARANSTLTLGEIKQVLSRGGYVIASVTPEIRFPQKVPSRRGGHLVLVFGFDDEKEVFYLHNPSGFEGAQENVKVTYEKFSQFFDHKGVMVFPHNS